MEAGDVNARAVLTERCPPPPWSTGGVCECCIEALEERAAILEFDAGFTRKEAERRAWELVMAPTEAVA